MKSARSLVLAAVLLAGCASAYAQTVGVPSGTYASDRNHTNVLWTVSHFGVSNYVGRFDGVEAVLELDAADPAKSKLTATIDPKSVDVNYEGEKDFAGEIAGPMFFDAPKFDEIRYVSTSIETTGADTGRITGDLTFHGVTRPVVLDAKMNAQLNPHPMSKKPVVGFSATGTIKRSDFGVTALVGPIGDDVELTIETEFSPAK